MLEMFRVPSGWPSRGWHLEAESPDAPLTYKGVVFNEMKGVYSSADSLLYRELQKHLFAGHPIYSIDSGGDPRAIPDLTYEQFANFHRTCATWLLGMFLPSADA